MNRIEPLTAQIAAGQYAAHEIRAAENMMSRIAHWDLLTPAEKAREYADHFNPDCAPSRFYEVPGFEPVECAQCGTDVFPDFRNDPDGECPFGPATHALWMPGNLRAAA